MGDIFGGLTEFFQGLIGVIILGAFIAGVYPTAISSYGNTTVFSMGAIVMLIIGVIPLFYLFAIMKNGYDKVLGNRGNQGGGLGGF